MAPRRRVLFTTLRIVVGLGLVVFLTRSGVLKWSALGGLVTFWPLTLCAIALQLTGTVVTAWRLCVLMRPTGMALSLGGSLRLLLIGLFFNMCLPGSAGGDLVRIYYAARDNKGRRTEITTILLLDRVAGLFALLLWPLLASVFFMGLVRQFPVVRALLAGAALMLLILSVGLLVVFSGPVRSSRLARWAFARLPFGATLERMVDSVRMYQRHAVTLGWAVVISLVAHTMSVGIMLLLAAATNPHGFSWTMSILIPVGFLVNTVPLTPGGLGVGEAAFGKLFGLVGLTGGPEVLMAWRLTSALLSLIGLGFYLEGRGEFVATADPVSSGGGELGLIDSAGHSQLGPTR